VRARGSLMQTERQRTHSAPRRTQPPRPATQAGSVPRPGCSGP
jgi:hypothetical protein